jgi:hypothetical protein
MQSRAESPLEEAERHVREGEGKIARQKEILAKLERDDHVAIAYDGRHLLALMQQTQRLSREHLKIERLKDGGEGSGSSSL